MSSPDYDGVGVENRTRTLFGQVMWYVAATAGAFALGAYLGRSLSYGFAFVFYLGALGSLIGMRFAARTSESTAVVLMLIFGGLIGLATAPVLAYYASTNPEVLWQAGGATALFMAGLGVVGYGTRRDLSAIGRISFFALLALIVFGIVLIFVNIPQGQVIYSVLGLVIFAGLTLFDFQRLRHTQGIDSPPLLAASIFLDALNVFLFLLNIFKRRD